MSDIKDYYELRHAINSLESKQALLLQSIKSDLSISFTNISPSYLFKNTLQALTSNLNLNGGLLTTALGMVMGYVSRKICVNTSISPLKKLIGMLILILTTHLISRNPDKVQKMYLILKQTTIRVINLFNKYK